MGRTRKWAYVAQEAGRLAGLGLGPRDIAARLGVNRSSVTRWIQQGKLGRERQSTPAAKPPKELPKQSPTEWGASVRKDYDLNATDRQLVELAEQALRVAHNLEEPASVRMTATGRFQALVKQLVLTMRSELAAEGPPAEAERPEPVKRTGTDPRAILMAVK